jgi:hypothetical protein
MLFNETTASHDDELGIARWGRRGIAVTARMKIKAALFGRYFESASQNWGEVGSR